MAKNHIENVQYVIRKMEVVSSNKYYLTSIRMAQVQKTNNTKVFQAGVNYTTDGNL